MSASSYVHIRSLYPPIHLTKRSEHDGSHVYLTLTPRVCLSTRHPSLDCINADARSFRLTDAGGPVTWPSSLFEKLDGPTYTEALKAAREGDPSRLTRALTDLDQALVDVFAASDADAREGWTDASEEHWIDPREFWGRSAPTVSESDLRVATDQPASGSVQGDTKGLPRQTHWPAKNADFCIELPQEDRIEVDFKSGLGFPAKSRLGLQAKLRIMPALYHSESSTECSGGVTVPKQGEPQESASGQAPASAQWAAGSHLATKGGPIYGSDLPVWELVLNWTTLSELPEYQTLSGSLLGWQPGENLASEASDMLVGLKGLYEQALTKLQSDDETRKLLGLAEQRARV